MTTRGYEAYGSYQCYAHISIVRYLDTRAAVWSYIASACVALSLTE